MSGSSGKRRLLSAAHILFFVHAFAFGLEPFAGSDQNAAFARERVRCMNAQAGFVGDTAGGTATRVPVIVWLAFAIAILSAAAGLVSGPGNRFGWWDYRMAFGVLRWAAWGGVAGAALSLAALVLSARRRAPPGILLALIGLLAGGPP